MTITSSEALRLSLLSGPEQVALAAAQDDDARQAAATLANLEPWAESDGPPGAPWCNWCGRHAPPSGLDQGHECNDVEDCDRTRNIRLERWMTAQTPWWRIDYQKYLASLRYEQELRARARFGGGIYSSFTDQVDAGFLLALDAVRQAAEPRALQLAAEFGNLVSLAAEGLFDPATPEAPPKRISPERFDPWAHTLRSPQHHRHLLAHFRQHPRVTDSAAALARKNLPA